MSSPSLIVFCGLPGVGKSTASAHAAEQRAAVRYRSDEVRSGLFDDPEYTETEIRRTYAELFDRARSDLEDGTDVVLDATFRARRFRNRAADLARETGADLTIVRVTCDSEVVRQRLADREGTYSDADFDTYRAFESEFEPIERDHAVVDNSGSLSDTRRQVEEAVL